MGQILHGSATTTHAIRAAIQRSKAPLKELAALHGLNQKTVAKWRKRAFVHDAPMGPKTVRSTVLTAEEEAMVVAFRKHTLLPQDDCLYALQATIPHLTRSSLHRCFQRHGISRLPEVAGDKPAKHPTIGAAVTCRWPQYHSRGSGADRKLALEVLHEPWPLGPVPHSCFVSLPRDNPQHRHLAGVRERLVLIYGESKLKHRPSRFIRGGPKLPLMRLNDRTAYRQPHTKTGLFGRVEGIEDALEHRRSQARTGITYCDVHAFRFIVFGAYPQFTRPVSDFGHCLDCVDHQVENHLLQLDTVSPDCRQDVCEFGFDRHSVLQSLSASQHDDLTNQVVYVQTSM
jgi:transposase-like protein